nr:EOG090X0B12 [Triops cancriformis]
MALGTSSQEQDEKLLQFQEMTGIHDAELSRSILAQHDWNLEAAIHDHLGLEDDDVDRRVHSAPPLDEIQGQGILARQSSTPVLNGNNQSFVVNLFRGFLYTLFNPRRAVTDPLGDITSFISQYDAKYGPTHPTFYQGTYSQALSDAKKELKFLLVYLHSPDHQDTERFCRSTLTSPSVISYINENMLFWGCSVTLPEGYRVSQALRENTYPFLALVVLRLNKMTIVGRLEGYVGPELLVQRLQALVSDNEAFLVAARADRNERSFNQSLRQEQDEAYQLSLMADREKEAKKRQEREEKEKAERQKQQELLEEEQKRQSMIQCKADAVALVPNEPAAADPDSVKLLFRLPSGQRLERRFLKTHTLRDIYHYVLSHPESPFNFEIASGFPRRNLPCLPEEGKHLPTLSEAGIGNAEVLHVSDLDA